MSDATSHPPSSIPIDTFSALAAKLHETTEGLLSFCHSMPVVENTSEEQTETDMETPEHGSKPGEYRKYYLPTYVLRDERELLERYDAENVADALNAVHNDLYVTAFLMKGYAAEEDVDGIILSQIGEQLLRPLEMLSLTGSILTDCELLQVTKVPA